MTTSPTADRADGPTADAIRRLHAALDGRIITADDDRYDRARTLFYGGLDSRPAVIARPTDAAGVAAVLRTAHDSGLALAVRSGGHGLLGHAGVDHGIVLDLGDLTDLEVDVDGRSAWAGAGLSAGAYTASVGAHGLATGFGDTGSVGIGGLTVGGGIGLLSRAHGLTIDQLLAAEVVTADGTVHLVDTDTEPDLFWAIRGGGGNVGVVTRFRFRLHDVAEVVGGWLVLPASAEVVHGFAAAADAAPEELSTIAAVMRSAPPLPFLPEAAHGRAALMALMAWSGDPDDADATLAPFRSLATPLSDDLRRRSYADLFPTEEAPAPVAVADTRFLDRVDRRSAEVIMAHLERAPSAMAVAQIRVLGGAIARVPAEATAYAHRNRRVMVNVAAAVEPGADAGAHRSWVAGLADALAPDGSGRYVNFAGVDGPDLACSAYPGATWERLAAIKRRYDPTNLFRRNINVPPSS